MTQKVRAKENPVTVGAANNKHQAQKIKALRQGGH